MAAPAPKTRDWRAIENAHKPKGLHVLVYGLVQVSATNMEPRLTEGPERNPKNLGLKLTIERSSGEGADVMVWKEAHFHKEVKADQYDHVVVRWNVEQIANVPVLNDRECADQAAAAMKTLNAQHPAGAKPAKPAKPAPPAKEPAAKAPAATKPAPAKPAPSKPAPKKPAPSKPAPKQPSAKKAPAKKKSAAKKQPRAVGGWAKGKKKAKQAKKAPKKATKKSGAKKKKKTARAKKRR